MNECCKKLMQRIEDKFGWWSRDDFPELKIMKILEHEWEDFKKELEEE